MLHYDLIPIGTPFALLVIVCERKAGNRKTTPLFITQIEFLFSIRALNGHIEALASASYQAELNEELLILGRVLIEGSHIMEQQDIWCSDCSNSHELRE